VGKILGRLTSFRDFVAAYGGAATLQLSSLTVPDYLALAVWAFFENGGQQLYVSRVAAADGSNNFVPGAADYQKALAALNGVKDVSIVAAPGSSVFGSNGGAVPSPPQATGVLGELIAHAEQLRHRFAVLDTPPSYGTSDVEGLRSKIDSSYAALYYPWVTIANPLAGATGPINVPPSGFVCGVYARTDAQQGVFKAPANQQVIGATGLERMIADTEGSALNELGIDTLRSFAGRGVLVWGARTVSSNSDWKYVNVRRYMVYLEQSIKQGTQWVVFEPNGPVLWGAIRNAIANFLTTEWRRGGMQGATASQAFIVKCDASTMTQNDIDNGRVICLVGVAAVRPAEFVILQIGWQISK
jgi:phage tail sheath protein FI